MSKPIQITVGVTSGLTAGASVYNNTSWAGLDGHIERVGSGPLDYADYEILTTGGFRLLNGNVFANTETFAFTATSSSYASAVSGPSVYTNGFDYNRVMAAMVGRLAFRDEEPASKSGRYYQDFHALVNVDNIRNTMPSGAVLATHLTQLQSAAILRVLNGVFREKEYYENVLLYEREESEETLVTNSGQFTGYEINIASDGKRAVQIDYAVLNFDTDVTFNLYLFKDGKKTAIWQQEVSAVADEATVVPLSDVVLTYLSGTTKGGRFFLGYFQDDLGGAKAIEEQVEFWAPTKMFRATPMYSLATGQDFDRVQLYSPSYSYGLNLEISSFRDHTAAIVSKPNLFDEAVGLQLTYMVIEQIIYAVRSNATERILKDQIDKLTVQLELNGYAPVSDLSKVEGIAQRIQKELDRINKSFFPKTKATTINLC